MLVTGITYVVEPGPCLCVGYPSSPMIALPPSSAVSLAGFILAVVFPYSRAVIDARASETQGACTTTAFDSDGAGRLAGRLIDPAEEHRATSALCSQSGGYVFVFGFSLVWLSLMHGLLWCSRLQRSDLALRRRWLRLLFRRRSHRARTAMTATAMMMHRSTSPSGRYASACF